MAMNLGLIKREPVAVAAFDFGAAGEVYREILEAQEETGGTVTYRAKIPSGGGKAFEILTGNEDTDTSVPMIEGVIIKSHKANAYWSENASMSDPPTCSSMDGIEGTDRETGECRDCEDCPFNKFGTANGGTKPGKACKNMIRLYIMTEGNPIPLILALPPTSIKAWQNYRVSVLATQGLKPTDAVTQITLTPTVSKAGDKYSLVKFRLGGRLNDDQRAVARMFAQGFAPSVELSGDDYNVPKEAENDAGERAAE